MRRRVLFIICLILAIAACVAAVLMSSGRNSRKFTAELYFFNESGTSIEAETKEIKYHDDIELVQEVVERLIKGPDNARHGRIIESGTKLLWIDMSDMENPVVNFSAEYLTENSTKDILSTYAVVKSLCTLDFVKSVKVLAEGNEIQASDGTAIGYLTAEDINLITDTNTSETREIMLYFTTKEYDGLVSEIRTIKVTDQQPIEQYIINELIRGPREKEHAATLSSDTVLAGVDIEDDICFVNFRPSFLDKNSGSQEKEILAVYSIVDSLTELKSITRVQFLVDGRKVDMFGSLNIGSMLGRNEDVIK